MSSLRDQILAASDIEREVVEVPEWDCTIEVRSPSGEARGRIAAVVNDTDANYQLLYPALLLPSLFDPESGERIFGDDDGEVLNAKNGAILERLATVALRLSGVTVEAVEEAKKGSS